MIKHGLVQVHYNINIVSSQSRLASIRWSGANPDAKTPAWCLVWSPRVHGELYAHACFQPRFYSIPIPLPEGPRIDRMTSVGPCRRIARPTTAPSARAATRGNVSSLDGHHIPCLHASIGVRFGPLLSHTVLLLCITRSSKKTKAKSNRVFLPLAVTAGIVISGHCLLFMNHNTST